MTVGIRYNVTHITTSIYNIFVDLDSTPMTFMCSTQSTNISNVNGDNNSLTLSSHTMLTTQYNEEIFHTGINTRLIRIEIFSII